LKCNSFVACATLFIDWLAERRRSAGAAAAEGVLKVVRRGQRAFLKDSEVVNTNLKKIFII
jgi:hypothetical protein